MKQYTYLLTLIISISLLFGCGKNTTIQVAKNNLLEISVVNNDQALWQYTVLKTGKTYNFTPPKFEIDGKLISAKLSQPELDGSSKKLINGVTEYKVKGSISAIPDIKLRILYRVAENNPVVKFQYELSSASTHKMTKTNGHDRIDYFKVSFNGLSDVKEIRF